MNAEYALITICDKSKQNKKNIKAIDLYTSNIFPVLRKNNHSNIDIYIMSAKYGLINENQKINYYEQFLTDERFEEIKDKSVKDLKKILDCSYKKIIVITGGNYKKIFENIKDERLYFCPFLRIKKIVKEFLIETNKYIKKLSDFK